ncbi:MAG: hypothetical protein ACK6CT_01925 [Planctomycetia bacterium]
MQASADAVGRGLRLVRIFHRDGDSFGRLRPIEAAAVPAAPRVLLDHRHHMTVAMERRHGGPVRLRVVAERAAVATGAWYAREILLLGGDDAVVQHGIVRIDLATVKPDVAATIRAGRIPLGRILLAADLLLEVQRVELLEIEPGPHLRSLFADSAGPAYGRVAEIVVNGRPAVELLEIVPPHAA